MEITEHERVLLVNSLIQTISELFEHNGEKDRAALGALLTRVTAAHQGVADRVELCLFGPGNRRERRVELTEVDGFVWHCYLPGVGPANTTGIADTARTRRPAVTGAMRRSCCSTLMARPSGQVHWHEVLFSPVRRTRGDQHSQQRPLHAAQCSYEPVFRLGE